MKRALRVLLPFAALYAAPVDAVVVTYSARDLADVVPGQDRWEYLYRLDEFPYASGYGFTVYFDPDLYADLEPNPPDFAEWDAVSFPPDPNLDDGYYDAQALFDLPGVDVVFRVAFRWLGAGTPGSQPFTVRESPPSYVEFVSGETLLPEPAQAALGASAIAALASLRRKAS